MLGGDFSIIFLFQFPFIIISTGEKRVCEREKEEGGEREKVGNKTGGDLVYVLDNFLQNNFL